MARKLNSHPATCSAKPFSGVYAENFNLGMCRSEDGISYSNSFEMSYHGICHLSYDFVELLQFSSALSLGLVEVATNNCLELPHKEQRDLERPEDKYDQLRLGCTLCIHLTIFYCNYARHAQVPSLKKAEI